MTAPVIAGFISRRDARRRRAMNLERLGAALVRPALAVALAALCLMAIAATAAVFAGAAMPVGVPTPGWP